MKLIWGEDEIRLNRYEMLSKNVADLESMLDKRSKDLAESFSNTKCLMDNAHWSMERFQTEIEVLKTENSQLRKQKESEPGCGFKAEVILRLTDLQAQVTKLEGLLLKPSKKKTK